MNLFVQSHSGIITCWPLGRVMVSGPAGLLFAALPLLLLLRSAVARPEPAVPFAEGDLLFFPITLCAASTLCNANALWLCRCKECDLCRQPG